MEIQHVNNLLSDFAYHLQLLNNYRNRSILNIDINVTFSCAYSIQLV